jgi:NAD(P)-dependent dehydrogenase (short-subunit alcohol dehydrogenase family)
MSFDFKDKNILVIGGSSGIGLSIVTEFLKSNAKVFSISRNVKKIESAKKELKKKKILKNATFLTNEKNTIEDLTKILKNLTENKIFFDVLINCNGYYEKMNLIDVTNSFWDEIYYNNIKLIFFTSQFLAKTNIAKRKKLNIINLSSFASIMPSTGYGIYASSKSALTNLTKTMAAEWSYFNIRVNCIMPGVIETPMTKNNIKIKQAELLLPIALKRIGKPNEVAHVALFLASEYSSYICGATIDVTGGKYIIQN